MAPRTSWRGSISFGLVNVPIGLTGAVTEKDVKFKQFTVNVKGEKHPVGRMEIDKETKEEVPRDRIRRGYEIGGEVVLISDDELEALAPTSSKTIEIEKFVEASEIDPLFFARHQYAIPQAGGEKGYALLVEAMAKSNKVGIARVVQRSKQHVVAVRSHNGSLCVTFLNYHDEVRKVSELELKPVEVSTPEIDMAVSLIDMLSAEWKPEEYKDEHREKVLSAISAKMNGTPLMVDPVPSSAPKVDDLMAALAASVAATQRITAGEMHLQSV